MTDRSDLSPLSVFAVLSLKAQPERARNVLKRDVIDADRMVADFYRASFDDVHFGGTDHVPPEAVKGAWRVGPDGIITGEFIANPNYCAVDPGGRP